MRQLPIAARVAACRPPAPFEGEIPRRAVVAALLVVIRYMLTAKRIADTAADVLPRKRSSVLEPGRARRATCPRPGAQSRRRSRP